MDLNQSWYYVRMMPHKLCSRCRRERSLRCFRNQGSNPKRPKKGICKTCEKKYMQDYYLKNKEAIKKQATEFRVARKKDLIEYVNQQKDRPCADCKIKYAPWVMQFDHVKDTKVASISAFVRAAVSLEDLRSELAKCELVCANCHAERTHKRAIKNSPALVQQVDMLDLRSSGPKGSRFESGRRDQSQFPAHAGVDKLAKSPASRTGSPERD